MSTDQTRPEAFIAPVQPEDVRKANLKGVQPSIGTASGIAAMQAAGIKPTKPEHEGSPVPIAGGPPEPDLKGLGTAKSPVGAQAQPAAFVSNGSIPGNVSASNYGFVPVGQLDRDPKRAHEIAKAQIEAPSKAGNLHSDGPPRLTREQIDRANASELRAAAYDRGFDLGTERGSRGTRAAFIEAQNKRYGEEKSAATTSQATPQSPAKT